VSGNATGREFQRRIQKKKLESQKMNKPEAQSQNLPAEKTLGPTKPSQHATSN